MKLKLQEFIENNPDWEAKLQEKPYCLTVSRAELFGKRLVMFKYSQIDSDFSERICCEARGIVLDEDTAEVVSYGFDKFFNCNESRAAKLDPSSMISTTKIDGSILKVVRIGNDVLISTNGKINAYDAPVAEQLGCKYKSFGEIADEVILKKLGSKEKFISMLEEKVTYIFELVSPWTRVCTPYPENDLWLIGCRSNDPKKDYRETFFRDCLLAKLFKTPEILNFSTIEKCLEYAQTLDWTSEGFVVMDKDFRRVKVKNASWLAVHHLAENHTMSYERAVEIARANEIDEVLGYFPEFEPALKEVQEKYQSYIASLKQAEKALNELMDGRDYSRKDIAIYITKNFKTPGVGFALLDKKVSSVEEFVNKMQAKNLVAAIGVK